MGFQTSRSPFFAILGSGLIALSLTTPLFCDSITLKTGEVFGGRILRITPDEVSIQLESGGILSFRLNRIAKVQHMGHPEESPPLKGTENFSEDPGNPNDFHRDPLPKESWMESNPSPDPGSDPSYRSGKTSQPKEFQDRRGTFPSPGPDPNFAAGGNRNGGSSWVLDPQMGFFIVPPKGFKPISDPKFGSSIRGFSDLSQRAHVLLTTYDSEESLDRIKGGVVALHRHQSMGKVLRESRRTIRGPDESMGWLLEIETSVAGMKQRLLQLLAKKGKKVFLITCAAPEEDFFMYQGAFEDCLDSFQFRLGSEVKMNRNEPPTERGNPLSDGQGFGEPSGNAPLSKEVLSQSKDFGSGDPRPTIVPEIDTEILKKRSDRITEKVDEKIRKSPFGMR